MQLKILQFNAFSMKELSSLPQVFQTLVTLLEMELI